MGTWDPVIKGYHTGLRNEILELVPTSAKRILDLGCATGALGKALKQRQACHVTGIEINKEAAQLAAKDLDAVYQDNLNRFDPAYLTQKYDCIIFADILEHLINPWPVLKKFADVLTDDGVVVTSIPNVGHPAVARQIQNGLFRYEIAGILDITHLRFFTKTSIFQLFYRAGLKIVNLKQYPSAEDPCQYLVTAVKPRPRHKNPVATILTLTCNEWKYTKMTLDSIKKKTHTPYKIVVIDNGSTDETIQELRKDRSIYHIENSCNLGFSTGFNLGMILVDTPYFVLSNNDVIVTENWLATMIEHIESNEDLVLLGARSNYACGPQIIEDIPYKDEKGLDAFALERLAGVKEPITYYLRVVFFFVLFKSRVLPEIGFFDERFGKGNFEDDDYCMRVYIKKLKAAFDNTVFIHHWGNRTFIANKITHKDLMTENKEKFMKKWGLKKYERCPLP